MYFFKLVYGLNLYGKHRRQSQHADGVLMVWWTEIRYKAYMADKMIIDSEAKNVIVTYVRKSDRREPDIYLLVLEWLL